MKLILKLLLSVCVLIAFIYAATPLWIPLVLARQLPSGFQVDSFEASYPGVSKINIAELSVKGDVAGYKLELSATDIQLSYKAWKTDIGFVTADVDMKTDEPGTAVPLNLDDLSLPITKLTNYPPEIAVHDMRVIIHHGMNFEQGNIRAEEPLALNFQALKLLRGANNTYRLSSGISTDFTRGLTGRLDVETNANSRKASLRFPAVNTSPWLDISIDQTDQPSNTTTLIRALLDTQAIDRNWLDSSVEQISGGQLTQIDGKLEMEARFTGQDLQHPEYLALIPEHLKAWSDEDSLILNGMFVAKHKDGQIIVSLPEPTEIQFEDHSGRIDDLFELIAPDLHLQGKESAIAHAEMDTGGDFILGTGPSLSVAFRGGFSLNITSPGRRLGIYSPVIQLNVPKFPKLDSISAKGVARLNWEEEETITYVANGLDLKASEISVSAEVVSDNGTLFTSGSGNAAGGEFMSMATSATGIDVSWQQFDLLTWSGEIAAKTQGFKTEFENETWTGFDFDIGFSLHDNLDIQGSGLTQIGSDLTIPIEFQGNATARSWNIVLPAYSIRHDQLDSLLSVSHLDLPDSIAFSDGVMSLQGKVLIDDGFNASMSINGREIGGSLHESSAYNAAFSLETTYGDTVRANGPVSIETIELAGGVEVNKIKTALNVESMGVISLQNLSAGLFDGLLKLDKLRYADNRIDETTIELTHISLAQLLAFAEIDGLKGTGFLAFSLPTGSDENGIYVKNGSFKSSGPGSLIYKKEGIASSNIGLQALENFQYESLSGTVDYLTDGTYRIGVRLEGKNPDLYGGHPIDFNLNITGSLPALFEALFMTGDFEESILEQIGIK